MKTLKAVLYTKWYSLRNSFEDGVTFLKKAAGPIFLTGIVAWFSSPLFLSAKVLGDAKSDDVELVAHVTVSMLYIMFGNIYLVTCLYGTSKEVLSFLNRSPFKRYPLYFSCVVTEILNGWFFCIIPVFTGLCYYLDLSNFFALFIGILSFFLFSFSGITSVQVFIQTINWIGLRPRVKNGLALLAITLLLLASVILNPLNSGSQVVLWFYSLDFSSYSTYTPAGLFADVLLELSAKGDIGKIARLLATQAVYLFASLLAGGMIWIGSLGRTHIATSTLSNTNFLDYTEGGKYKNLLLSDIIKDIIILLRSKQAHFIVFISWFMSGFVAFFVMPFDNRSTMASIGMYLLCLSLMQVHLTNNIYGFMKREIHSLFTCPLEISSSIIGKNSAYVAVSFLFFFIPSFIWYVYNRWIDLEAIHLLSIVIAYWVVVLVLVLTGNIWSLYFPRPKSYHDMIPNTGMIEVIFGFTQMAIAFGVLGGAYRISLYICGNIDIVPIILFAVLVLLLISYALSVDRLAGVLFSRRETILHALNKPS